MLLVLAELRRWLSGTEQGGHGAAPSLSGQGCNQPRAFGLVEHIMLAGHPTAEHGLQISSLEH